MERPTRLMNWNFFLLWQGQLVSLIGSEGFTIAVIFWVKHATGSASLIGILLMASTLPSVIIGPIGGTFADRHSRRKIIIFSDLLSGAALLSLAFMIFFSPYSKLMILVCIFIVCMMIAAIRSFFTPAISAAIPDLVPENKVAGANSLNQFSVELSTFIGQGLGGVLFRLLGPVLLFLVDGVTYLFSALSESFITIPQVIPEKGSEWKSIIIEFKRDILEGFFYIWKRTGMRDLFMASAFLNLFTAPVITLFPFYVEDFLKAGVDWYGFLLAAFGAGTMIGFLFSGSLKITGKTRSRMILFFIICESLEFVILGFVRTPIIALFLSAIMGMMNGFIDISILTILQLTTPSEIRGRVFGILGTLAGGISPISMGLSGVVADMINQNIPLLYSICGGILSVFSILLSLNKEFRAFLAYEAKADNAE